MFLCLFATFLFMKYDNDLIILGMGKSRHLCNFDTEVWSCNNGYMQIAEQNGTVSKIFLTHPQHKQFVKGELRDAYSFDQMNMLVDHGVDIYNIHECEGLNHKKYPLKTIRKKFQTDFFSDTITYMLAFAIDRWTKVDRRTKRVVLKNPKENYRIRTFGVDMATFDGQGSSGEYQMEKGGVEYWVGVARGIGINVEIGNGSQVCQTITGFPYGVKYWNRDDFDPFHLIDDKIFEGLAF